MSSHHQQADVRKERAERRDLRELALQVRARCSLCAWQSCLIESLLCSKQMTIVPSAASRLLGKGGRRRWCRRVLPGLGERRWTTEYGRRLTGQRACIRARSRGVLVQNYKLRMWYLSQKYGNMLDMLVATLVPRGGSYNHAQDGHMPRSRAVRLSRREHNKHETYAATRWALLYSIIAWLTTRSGPSLMGPQQRRQRQTKSLRKKHLPRTTTSTKVRRRMPMFLRMAVCESGRTSKLRLWLTAVPVGDHLTFEEVAAMVAAEEEQQPAQARMRLRSSVHSH